MIITHLRVLITVIAAILAINFAILIYILPNHSSIFLTIEVILLPYIYIIGNYYIEEFIKKEYEWELSIIEEESLKLKDRYIKQKYLNEILKRGKK